MTASTACLNTARERHRSPWSAPLGFFPDAVFARGIDIVAGTRVLDSARARHGLAANRKLDDCASRIVLRRNEYPGFEQLLARAVGACRCE